MKTKEEILEDFLKWSFKNMPLDMPIRFKGLKPDKKKPFLKAIVNLYLKKKK